MRSVDIERKTKCVDHKLKLGRSQWTYGGWCSTSWNCSGRTA